MAKIESLAIDLIKTNLGTQMRAKVNDDTVEHYAELWKAKHEFPPLDVFYDGETYILADGFHRLYGAKAAKRASLQCRIHKGGVREAILFACGANHDHGLHRSRADKRTAVEALLDDGEWGKRSARWIAETCKVSHTFVATVVTDRKPSVLASGGNVATSKVEAKDGKTYPATKPAPAKPADEPVVEGENESPPSVCPKGGDHEWGPDDDLQEGRVICLKCFDPAPDSQPEPAPPAEPPAGKLFGKLLEHLRQSVLLLDEINKVTPNPKARQEIFDSLECANQDILKWRKSAK